MKTTNKLKAASRLGAIALAAAAYVFLGSNQAGAEANSPMNQDYSGADDEYLFVDEEHDMEGETATLQEIIEDNLCPAEGRDCAVPLTGNKEIIEWQGPTMKF